MIDRYETDTNLRLTINGAASDKTMISVGRDSGDQQIVLALRRWQPLFDCTAFLTTNEARELAKALTEITGEWTPKADQCTGKQES